MPPARLIESWATNLDQGEAPSKKLLHAIVLLEELYMGLQTHHDPDRLRAAGLIQPKGYAMIVIRYSDKQWRGLEAFGEWCGRVRLIQPVRIWGLIQP